MKSNLNESSMRVVSFLTILTPFPWAIMVIKSILDGGAGLSLMHLFTSDVLYRGYFD